MIEGRKKTEKEIDTEGVKRERDGDRGTERHRRARERKRKIEKET